MALEYGQRSRYAHIDALRAIGAILVAWTHVSYEFVSISDGASMSGHYLNDIAKTVDFGRIGVIVFFFVSGFVIPSSLRGPRRTGALRFVISRMFRVYPAYWFCIPLAVVAIWWMPGQPIHSWEILANLTILQNVFGARDIEGLFWTLRVELLFYAICLALFLTRLLDAEIVLFTLVAGLVPVHVILRLLLWPDLPAWAVWGEPSAFLSMMFTGTLLRRAHDGKIGLIGKFAVFGSLSWWLGVVPLLALGLYMTTGPLDVGHIQLFSSYPLGVLISLLE